MNETLAIELEQNFGIEIVEEKPAFKGNFLKRVHHIIESEYSFILKENESFKIPSELLLSIISEAGNPFVSDECLIRIIKGKFQSKHILVS